MPKLFLHSPDDVVIPYAHGRRLFDAARAPKQFVDVRGGHDDAYRVDKTVYYGAIAGFLRENYSAKKGQRLLNSRDMIFRDRGAQLILPVVTAGEGYAATYSIAMRPGE